MMKQQKSPRSNRDDVGVHEGHAVPARQQGGRQRSGKPEEAQEEAEELSTSAGHALPAQTLRSREAQQWSVTATGDYGSILNHQH